MNRTQLILALVLFIVTLLLYAPLRQFAFLNYDDPQYVTENAHVRQGLTPATLRWAMTSRDAANWHPLTWLSHALDWQLFGADAGRHHLVNALLHSASAALLMIALVMMTGATWRSTLVAALFALHPLHVESVAWVSERKDTLSGLLMMLTLIAYVRYTRRPAVGRYAAVVVLFALGLMAKPMLVTLPLVLWVLDYWPLRRLTSNGASQRRRIVIEKLPLLGLSIISALITVIAQRGGGAMASGDRISLPWRFVNAVITSVSYLRQMLWPVNLSIYYPHPAVLGHLMPWRALAASAAALVAITLIAIYLPRTRPYLLSGWWWYLITLLPVIGLVQVGQQGHADRYTYIPLIGIFIAISWLLGDLASHHRVLRLPIIALALGCLIACFAASRLQIGHWRSSETVFAHAVIATPDSPVAHNQLGLVRERQGNSPAAAREFEAAVALDPEFVGAWNNLGLARRQNGDIAGALAAFRRAIAIRGDYVDALFNLGNALSELGQHAKALKYLERAIDLKPRSGRMRYNYALALGAAGRVDEAIEQLRKASTDQPDDPDIRLALAKALLMRGRVDEAIEAYQAAVRHDSNSVDASAGLADALARGGRIDGAISEIQHAIELARSTGRAAMARQLELRLAAYRSAQRAGMMPTTRSSTAPSPSAVPVGRP
jgi:tetratricopeptide (TPR) repeat protein